MKNLILASILSLTTVSVFAKTEPTVVEFPRNMECLPSADLVNVLTKKYGEMPVARGTSMNHNKEQRIEQPNMWLFYNSSKNTYTFVNEYERVGLACVVDSGILELYSPEKNKPASTH